MTASNLTKSQLLNSGAERRLLLPELMRFLFLFESVQWSTNCCHAGLTADQRAMLRYFNNNNKHTNCQGSRKNTNRQSSLKRICNLYKLLIIHSTSCRETFTRARQSVSGRPFVKRFALYAIGQLSCLACLSVTLVYCCQTVGWIKIKHGMEVDWAQATLC